LPIGDFDDDLPGRNREDRLEDSAALGFFRS
jgi:hypothetical protein